MKLLAPWATQPGERQDRPAVTRLDTIAISSVSDTFEHPPHCPAEMLAHSLARTVRIIGHDTFENRLVLHMDLGNAFVGPDRYEIWSYGHCGDDTRLEVQECLGKEPIARRNRYRKVKRKIILHDQFGTREVLIEIGHCLVQGFPVLGYSIGCMPGRFPFNTDPVFKASAHVRDRGQGRVIAVAGVLNLLDIRARPSPRDDHSLISQARQRFANHRARNAQILGELILGRQSAVYRIVAGMYARCDFCVHKIAQLERIAFLVAVHAEPVFAQDRCFHGMSLLVPSGTVMQLVENPKLVVCSVVNCMVNRRARAVCD